MYLKLTDWDDFIIAKALIGHFKHHYVLDTDNYLYYISKKAKEDKLHQVYYEVRSQKHDVNWPHQQCTNIQNYIRLLMENQKLKKTFLDAPYNPHLYYGTLHKLQQRIA